MIRRPPRSTLFPYTTALPIFGILPFFLQLFINSCICCIVTQKFPLLLNKIRGTVPSGFLNRQDRKSTRLNSSHANISYAVFCLKKKKTVEKYFSAYRSSTN